MAENFPLNLETALTKPDSFIQSILPELDPLSEDKLKALASVLESGTVIDKQVISPDVFEFYLQCPEVDRGTGSPVHFLCLYNNNEDLTINDFEEITYQQSFYYWNWSGPIRIPAALKYAEVANNFSGKNLKGEVIDKLKDSPYFI